MKRVEPLAYRILDRCATLSQNNFRCMRCTIGITPATPTRRSADRCKVLHLPLQHLLVESADRILVEVRSVPVVVQRRLIRKLLVDHHRRWLTIHKVRLVAHAPRLLPRTLGQPPQHLRNLFPVARLKPHPHCKAHHRPVPYPFSAASNSGSAIVCSRSGPVETMPIFAFDSFSRNLRYSCASF